MLGHYSHLCLTLPHVFVHTHTNTHKDTNNITGWRFCWMHCSSFFLLISICTLRVWNWRHSRPPTANLSGPTQWWPSFVLLIWAPQGLTAGAGSKILSQDINLLESGLVLLILDSLSSLSLCGLLTDLHSVRRQGCLSWNIRHVLLLQCSSLITGHLQRRRQWDRHTVSEVHTNEEQWERCQD